MAADVSVAISPHTIGSGRIDARQRYEALLFDAVEQLAAEPHRPLTRNRSDPRSGIRSFHVRHARRGRPADSVRAPVHIIYYRADRTGVIEIVRGLHERMQPSRHLDAPLGEPDH